MVSEEDTHQQRFGDAYLDYRARVNELVPIPRVLARKRKPMSAYRNSRTSEGYVAQIHPPRVIEVTAGLIAAC